MQFLKPAFGATCQMVFYLALAAGSSSMDQSIRRHSRQVAQLDWVCCMQLSHRLQPLGGSC